MKITLKQLIVALLFFSLASNQLAIADNTLVKNNILSLSKSAEQLLNLAERHFGQYFNSPLNTQFAPPEWLYYRGPYDNNIYLAININGSVYVTGGEFGNSLLNVGRFQEILTLLQNIGNTTSISPNQLHGIWWQLVTSSCSFISCTESAFLYRFDSTNCVQNTCAGSRQSWINNGNGFNAPQASPFSYAWITQGNIIQLSFSSLSNRSEIYTINRFNEGVGVLELSSNDFRNTRFIKCGSIGFPVFIGDSLGC
jgi:hypothetical protein